MVAARRKHLSAAAATLAGLCLLAGTAAAQVDPPAAATPSCDHLNADLMTDNYPAAAARLRRGAPTLRCPVPVGAIARALIPPGLSLATARPRGADDDAGCSDYLRGGGRYEFATVMTLSSVYYGVLSMIAVDPSEEAAYFLFPAALGGVGMWASLRVTRGGTVALGTAAALRSGGWLATAQYVTMLNAFDVNMQEEELAFDLLLTHAGGSLAGWLVARAVEPDDGQVAMVNSGAIWGAAGAWLASIALNLDPSFEQDTWLAVMIGMDLGMVGGAIAARAKPMSRARTAILDAGALAGGVLGAGVYVLVVGEATRPRAVASSSLFGTALGMAGAYVLTDRFDTADDRGRGPEKSASGGAKTRVSGLSLTVLTPPSALAPPVPGARLLRVDW